MEMSKPRAILPTYVTDELFILCKKAPAIRNAYEIRLALYFAAKSNRQFLLVVPKDCVIDLGVENHIIAHGGRVKHDDVKVYSVYFGAIDADGEEVAGWVLGDNERWDLVLSLLNSAWLKTHLRIGTELSGTQLDLVTQEMSKENVSTTNVDDEPFSQAVLDLAALAKDKNGAIYVQ